MLVFCLFGGLAAFPLVGRSILGKICESATDTLAGTRGLLLLEGFWVPVQGNGIDHQHNEYCATLKHTALSIGSSGRRR